MSSQCLRKINKIHDALMSEQCTICSRTFELKQGDQPNVIQIQNEYYCQICLQRRLIQEQQHIKHIQQRYIYYKEYQSSFNTREFCQAELQQNSQKSSDFSQVQQLQKETLELQQLVLKTKQECKILRQKVVLIQNQEQKFWDSVNRFQKRAIKLQEKALTARLEKANVKSQSDVLTTNSLYHQVFKITIKDNIGYISGLAMGKKTDATQIQWDQFNSGLGHLFLAMNILTMKYEYSYVKFQQVILKCNMTQVLLYGKQKRAYIYYSKENDKIFGEVMEALLTQIFHFSYHLMQVLNLEYNPQVKLPYPIKQKQFQIADVPINPNKVVQKHKWSKWSQGIKYLLIDFKHLMTIHVIYGKD